MGERASLIACAARRFQVVRDRICRRRAARTVAWPVVEVNERNPGRRTEDTVAPVHLETDGTGCRRRQRAEQSQLFRGKGERGAVRGERREKTVGRGVELAHATLDMALERDAR